MNDYIIIRDDKGKERERERAREKEGRGRSVVATLFAPTAYCI